MSYFDLVMKYNSLEKSVMLGMVGGSGKQVWQTTHRIDTIRQDTGLNVEILKQKLERMERNHLSGF